MKRVGAITLRILYIFPLYLSPGGISSIGRVRRSQRRGRGIETLILQFFDSREYDELQSETHIMTRSTTKITDGGLAQLVECVVSNDEAPGSKPGFSTHKRLRSLVGRALA